MKLSEEQISKIKEVLESFEDIEFAFILGSYARGNANDLSDIDIAIFQNKKNRSIVSSIKSLFFLSKYFKLL